jgi:hypothetical protein
VWNLVQSAGVFDWRGQRLAPEHSAQRKQLLQAAEVPRCEADRGRRCVTAGSKLVGNCTSKVREAREEVLDDKEAGKSLAG